MEKVEKLIYSIKDKGNYVIDVRASKQALNPWVSNKKSTESNSVETKSMVKAIYWHEYWIKKNSPKWIWE